MALLLLPEHLLADIIGFAAVKTDVFSVVQKYDKLCLKYEQVVRLRAYADICEETHGRFERTFQPGLELAQELEAEWFASSCKALKKFVTVPMTFLDVREASWQLRGHDRLSVKKLLFVSDELTLSPEARHQLKCHIWEFALLRENLRRDLLNLALVMILKSEKAEALRRKQLEDWHANLPRCDDEIVEPEENPWADME